MPKHAGIENKIPNLIDLEILSFACFVCLFLIWVDKIGSSAVLIAIPKTPRGS